MSLDRKRWAILAQDLKFSQLDVARKQAEAWRTGLTALTALLTAILVLKGRDNVSALDSPFQWIVVALLGLALIALVTATMLVTRSIAGPPEEQILLSGEDLEEWSGREVGKISAALRKAPWLAAAGVACVAFAVGLTWLAPAQETTAPTVQVAAPTGQVCGELVGVSQHQLILHTEAGTTLLLPLSAVASLTPVDNC